MHKYIGIHQSIKRHATSPKTSRHEKKAKISTDDKSITLTPKLNQHTQFNSTPFLHASSNDHSNDLSHRRATPSPSIIMTPGIQFSSLSRFDTACLLGAKNGHSTLVTQLLQTNPTALINAPHHWLNGASRSDAALLQAANSGHTDLVTRLLQTNPLAFINAPHHWSNKSSRFDAALILAADNGHADLVIQLLQTNPNTLINAPHHWSNNSFPSDAALILAANNGHIDLVNQLLQTDSQSRINAPSSRFKGMSRSDAALLQAAANSRSDLVMNLLETNPSATINKPDHWLNGFSRSDAALLQAATKGHRDLVTQLLEFNTTPIDQAHTSLDDSDMALTSIQDLKLSYLANKQRPDKPELLTQFLHLTELSKHNLINFYEGSQYSNELHPFPYYMNAQDVILFMKGIQTSPDKPLLQALYLTYNPLSTSTENQSIPTQAFQPDVHIIIGDQSYYLHSVVLKRIPYFKNRNKFNDLSTNKKTIKIIELTDIIDNTVDRVNFQTMIKYHYTFTISDSLMSINLFKICTYFLDTSLANQCAKTLIDQTTSDTFPSTLTDMQAIGVTPDIEQHAITKLKTLLKPNTFKPLFDQLKGQFETIPELKTVLCQQFVSFHTRIPDRFSWIKTLDSNHNALLLIALTQTANNCQSNSQNLTRANLS